MRFHREERAQAIVLIAIVASALLFGVGLAIDTGQLYAGRRAAQTAADSAAWAGAVVIFTAGTSGFTVATSTAAETAAIADALWNGYTIAAADVNVPPTTGPATGDPGFVEVNITTQVTTAFFPGPRPVTVRAVAGAARTGTGEALHVIATGGVANALNLTGVGRVVVTNGNVFVRSTSASSINIAAPPGNIGIDTTSSGVATRTRGTFAAGDSVKVQPQPPTTGVAAGAVGDADPFASLPGPTAIGCVTPLVACSSYPPPAVGGVKTIPPGIYNGGISITSGTTTFAPGTYILRNGGLNVSGTGSITTTGVFIYNTNTSYPAAGGACGAVNFTSSGSITLAARTTGSYAGITIFQDAVCTNRMIWGGTGARAMSGTYYIRPGAVVVPALRFNATGAGVTMNLAGQIVVPTYEGIATTLNLSYVRSVLAGARAPLLSE